MSIPRRAAAVVLLRLAAGSAALGDALLRPGEMRLLQAAAEDGVEVLVKRVVAVGSELRAELELGDGTTLWGRLDRTRAEELELREGQIVLVRLSPRRVGQDELPRAA